MRNTATAIVAAAFLLLTACGSQERQTTSEDLHTSDSQEAIAPGVDVTAAPGVAFNYRYAFRLPSNRISRVQEEHAAACERLGLEKCRITGMRYRLVNQKDIQAMLALRLDPRIARQFGKQATEVVTRAEGMLVDQEITGEDVGSRIAGANRTEAQLREELARIEAELARPVPMMRGNVAPQAAVDRQSLLNRAVEIRQQLGSVTERRGADEEALAGTPMVFNYGSGSVVPGFDVRSPLRDAFQSAADNFISGLAMILVLLVTLVPWAFLAALLIWLYRLARRRWGWLAPGDGRGYSGEGSSDPAEATRPEGGTAELR